MADRGRVAETSSELRTTNPSHAVPALPTRNERSRYLPPEQLADDILKKEQRIMEIMAEIKAVLKEKP